MADLATITGSGSGSLVDYLTDMQEEFSLSNTSYSASGANHFLSGNRKAQRAQNAYGSAGLSSAVGQAALKRALSEMGASGGKVTFADIAAYQKELEAAFSILMRIDLAGLGVSPETEFSLNISSEGVITVNCTDQAARETIEQYLTDNPKACEQFGYIQALANLDRAKQSPAAVRHDLKNARMAMQAEAVENFFGAAMSLGMKYSPLLASFAANDEFADYYVGVDYTV